MRHIIEWLERHGWIQHRHRWYVSGAFVKGHSTGNEYRRQTYYAVYTCDRCGAVIEEATVLGQAYQRKHGASKTGLTYVPLNLGWRQ